MPLRRSGRNNPRPVPPPEVTPSRQNRRNARVIVEDPIQPIPPTMSTSEFQTFMAQQIATALATFTATQAAAPETSHSGSGTGSVHRNSTHAYNYKDFMSCKPRNFNGTEGVIGFTRWVEKTETIFSISSCPENDKVKFAACTLVDAALTWWKDRVKSMGIEQAHALEWRVFKDMLLEQYCPRQELLNLEQELLTLTMKGLEVGKYTTRFNDLASLCSALLTPEYKKIERYIWGLSSPVKGLVTASRPTTYDSATQLAHKLTNQCVQDGKMPPQAEKTTEVSKRRLQGKGRGDSKRHKSQPEAATVHAITANPSTPPNNNTGEKPQCIKCGKNHHDECWFCTHCNIPGHLVKYCRKLAAATKVPTQAAGTSRTCYECNQPGHIRRDCPKLKNQGGRGRAFVIESGEALVKPEVVTGTFLINNIYATVLFDTGADKSFISRRSCCLYEYMFCLIFMII